MKQVLDGGIPVLRPMVQLPLSHKMKWHQLLVLHKVWNNKLHFKFYGRRTQLRSKHSRLLKQHILSSKLIPLSYIWATMHFIKLNDFNSFSHVWIVTLFEEVVKQEFLELTMYFHEDGFWRIKYAQPLAKLLVMAKKLSSEVTNFCASKSFISASSLWKQCDFCDREMQWMKFYFLRKRSRLTPTATSVLADRKYFVAVNEKGGTFGRVDRSAG